MYLMPESMRLRLTDDRELMFERLHEQIEDLPDERYKADVVDMALTHLSESIDNFENYDGDPELAKQFKTSIVRPRYRTWLELNKP